MNKELFVSSTPHETRVGMTEDDQVAEVYLELENEYTLAGSIYKGRVTRVLPGMQSAFVDIGLERDAFLYVSDFMEVEEGDEVEDIPTNRPPAVFEPRVQAPPQAASAGPSQSLVIEGPDFPEEESNAAEETAEVPRAAGEDDQPENSGDQEGRGN